MEKSKNIKALYIIVNVGFAEDVVDLVREAGAGGATIINARGSGALNKSILGISVDAEKEMVFSLVEEDVADRIMDAVIEKAGVQSPADGICFTLPVEKMIATGQGPEKEKHPKEKHK